MTGNPAPRPAVALPAGDIIRALLVAFIYGVSFVAIRIGLDDLPPLLLTGYRYFFTAIPLIFFVPRPKVPMSLLASYGIMQGVVMFGLVFTAIAMSMPAGLTSLVIQLQVFFTIGFAAIFFGERAAPHQIAGAVIGFAGIVVMGVIGGNAVPAIPFLLVVVAAAAWGIANIIAKQARPHASEMLGYIVWSSAFAPVPLFALSMMFEGTWLGLPPSWPTASAIASVAFLSVITTVWAFTMWVGLLNRHSAASVTPFALLIPVFGFASTALILGERVSTGIWLASLIVFAGLAISVLGFPKRKRSDA